jgi:hypothetical protein
MLDQTSLYLEDNSRLNQIILEQAIRELIKEHNLVPIGLKLINRTSSVYLESQDIIALNLCSTYAYDEVSKH